MCLLYISLIYTYYRISVMSSCHIPQTSIGKLVSLSVDNSKYYTSQQQSVSPPPPPLFPNSITHNEEQTMLWSNIATLFAKCDQTEYELQKHQESYERLTRGTDDLYQELQDTKIDIAQIQCENNENNMLSTQVRKLRKYVNKKCEKVRETVSYGSYNADNEIFAYIDKLRLEFQAKTAKMEDEIAGLQTKLEETEHIYDSDYTMFVERENDLMAKLGDAVQMTESLRQRVKDVEFSLMTQIQESRNYAEQHQYQCAGDLREEFTRAICREVEFESGVSAKLVQSVNEELFELITRSNEYHTARHFGLMEDVKESREMCNTLKQSIAMVDAELSDTKDTMGFLTDEVAQTSNDVYDMKEELTELKDEVYSELDRDYYDLKDYVKYRFHRHNKQRHAAATATTVDATDPLQMIVTEYTEEPHSASATVRPISNELAAFLGKPEGSVLARTEVTREVNAYIRDHKLQDKDNGRKINPDAKLLKLLKLEPGDDLTYFNIQKYIGAHFKSEYNENVIIIGATTINSDDEDEFQHL